MHPRLSRGKSALGPFFQVFPHLPLFATVGNGGDVPSATAILDRFLHHAEVITITARSYRLKDRATQEANQPKKAAKNKETACEKAKR